MEGRSAAVEANGMLRAAIFGEILLELGYIGPKAESAVVNRPGDGGIDFRAQGFDLGFQVKIRNRFGHKFILRQRNHKQTVWK
jgi:hypothetical protein